MADVAADSDTTLRELLDRSGVLSPKQAVAVLVGIAPAIDEAHADALVDPANIELRDGQAVSLRADGETGSATLAYLAPERLTENAENTGRTDVYSLACVLFECLTGTVPYPGADDPVALLSAHESEPVPRPSRRRSAVPAEFDAVIARALATDPTERYATAAELAAAAQLALDSTTEGSAEAEPDDETEPGGGPERSPDEDADTDPDREPFSGLRPSWVARAAALGVDVLPGIAVPATAVLVGWTVPQRSGGWWVCVSVGAVALLYTMANRLLVPAVTGRSLGRALLGIDVVDQAGDPAGPVRLLLRDLAHLLDTAGLVVGWLWPLWDSRRRTFADMLARTETLRGEPNHVRRLAGAVMSVAALLAVALSATGYFAVYRQERVLEQARAEISERGPKIVVDMLSYDPQTLAEDFSRAQALTTDSYRRQLVTVQEWIAKGATPHRYWVPESVVLDVNPHRATMLLFLKGEQGATGDQWYSISMVRVNYVKTADRGWLVDNMTFAPKPQPPPQAQQ